MGLQSDRRRGGIGKLNFRVAMTTLLVLLVLTGSLWALHRYQFRRLVVDLASQAEEKMSAKDYGTAVQLLQRLIALQPNRNQAIVDLATSHSQAYPDKEARLPQIIDRQIAYDSAALNAIEMEPKLTDRLPEIQRRLVEKNIQALRLDPAYRLLASMAGKEPDRWIEKKTATVMLAARLSGTNAPSLSQGEFPPWFVKLREQHPIDLLLAVHAADPSDIEIAVTLVNIATQLGSTKVMDGSAWAGLSAAALIAEASRIVDVLVDAAPSAESLILRAGLASKTPIQRKQDLEKVLEMNPDRLDALRGLVQIQIDAKRSGNSDPSLLMDRGSVESIMDHIESIAAEDRSQNVLLRGQWIAQLEGPKKAMDYWQAQLNNLDRPIEILNAMMAIALQDGNRNLAKQILLQMRDSIKAQQELETQMESRQSSWILAEAESRMAYEDGNMEMATKILEKAGFQGSIETRKIQWLRMAEGYRSMGLNEKAQEAIQRAAQIDPNDGRVTRMLADQLAMSGRLPEALNAMQSIEAKSPQDELAIAGMLLQTAKLAGVAAVDWNYFEQCCRRARIVDPKSTGSIAPWRVDLLELASNWLRNQPKLGKLGAEVVLRQATTISDANSTILECQEALIDNLNQWLPDTDIQPFVEHIASIQPDHPRVLIHRFNNALKEGRGESVVADLEAAYRKDPDARILNRLVLYAASLGKWDDIDRYVLSDDTNGARREKDLVRVCELLLENPPGTSFLEGTRGQENLRNQWLQAIQKYDQMLESLDSGYGFTWRWIRLRRLFEKETLQANDLKLASELLAKIESLRPNWDGLFALRGRLSEARGDVQRTIDSYSIAWSRDSLPEKWLSRYLVLLGREGRDAELKQVVEKMQAMGISRVQPAGAVATSNVDAEADRMIEEMIRLSPSDPSGHLLKHRVLLARAKSLQGESRRALEIEADEELEAARKISGDTSPGVFEAEIQRAQEKGDTDVVYSLLDRVLAASSIPTAKRFELIGATHISMGRMKDAIKALQQAVEAGGPRMELLSQIANCAAISGDVQLALASYRQLATDYPNNQFFKQRLVQFLAFIDRPEAWTEIRRILQVESKQASNESRYQFALVALNYGDIAHVEEAIQLLDGDSLLTNPESPIQILLARLMIRKAKAMYLDGAPADQIDSLYQSAANRLLESKGQDIDAVQTAVYLFSALMAEKRYEIAESVCARLGRIPGASAEVVACQARLAYAKGSSPGQVAALIEAYQDSLGDLPDTPAEIDEVLLLSRVQLLVGDASKGEAVLRKFCELYPQIIDLYAIATGATEDQVVQNAGRDYLTSFLEKNVELPGIDPLISFHIRTSKFDQELGPIVESAERIALNLFGAEKDRTKIALSNLLWSKGRLTEAASIIESCRKIKPLDPMLTNNHAMVLADVSGRSAEALELARNYVPDDVFDFNEWQDTLGYTLRATGQFEAAIKTLKSACTMSNSPRIRLHLAIALLDVGDQPAAIRLAEGIVERELRLELLSSSDREAWENLKKLLPTSRL
jgi:tetratricopeptide (TPR) repeat protein